MSKIYERFIRNCLSSYEESFLSKFVSACRKSYSSNHVLLRLIENWKKSLDNENFVGTILMDLSKAFDCISHDLLVAKLHAYGLSNDAVTFIYSYLKRRKQGVKINDTESIFQILLSGVPQGCTPDKYDLKINGSIISSEKSVTLLGIEIDNKLNFEKQVANICRKANNQLNAISRVQNFLGKKEKETIINSFVYSNFIYCPLTWHFCSKLSQNKIEKIQYRSLKMLTNDYNSDYKDLLEITKTSTMEIKRLRTLALEVFKTVNNLNPDFMKDIFYLSPYQTHKKYDIFVHSRNTASFGDKSLRALGPHVWNSLPENIKSTDTISVFKNFIKNWYGPKCKCKNCLL